MRAVLDLVELMSLPTEDFVSGVLEQLRAARASLDERIAQLSAERDRLDAAISVLEAPSETARPAAPSGDRSLRKDAGLPRPETSGRRREPVVQIGANVPTGVLEPDSEFTQELRDVTVARTGKHRDLTAAILDCLRQMSGLTASEIAERIDRPQNGVSATISRLAKTGRVLCVGEEGPYKVRRWAATPAATPAEAPKVDERPVITVELDEEPDDSPPADAPTADAPAAGEEDVDEDDVDVDGTIPPLGNDRPDDRSLESKVQDMLQRYREPLRAEEISRSLVVNLAVVREVLNNMTKLSSEGRRYPRIHREPNGYLLERAA